ncbi:MAG TPA: tetratricopeptide repeat-containing diguanylate cyclase [Rudaea sp.]|nr:tetratricopeptide repeat-containing diguanylate cyclase [Rudaea sp.]
MLRSVWLALVLSTAAAAATVDLPKLRHLSEAQPAQALADGRQLLDGGKLSDDPADAREVLRWMGRAALILADETAIAEVVLRLDGLAQTHADSVAKAYAGFLRAQHLAMQGHAREGLAEALGSADLLQEQKDPNLLALSDYNLCNAYYEAEEFSRALPFCQRAGDRSHQVGDGYEEARANNLEAIVRLNQNDNAAAIALLEHARDRMHALGEESMVVTFNDNLARLYIEQGRAAEALELARKAYEGDRAAGKLSYTALGRANIARALSALKRHDEAQTEIAASVDEARANKQASLLSDLLDTQSMIAEAAGDLKLALKSLRESHDIDQKNAPKQASGNTSISDLEARFATREKELQIRELEHANQAKQLQLAAANAQAAEHEQQMSRQKLVLAGAGAGLAALAIIVALLFKLLRVQKKYGAELSVQALRDPLTGVDNRRALFTNMRELLARATPQNEHALLLIDLDHFKRINDSHGHPAGDAVLVAVAMQLKQQLQGRCSLARLGGEEFAVLCPASGRDAALALAEELRLAVAGTSVRDLPVPTQVTASIGVAMFEGRGSLDDWMRAVDRALYAAKARGRNCVVEAASVRVNVA